MTRKPSEAPPAKHGAAKQETVNPLGEVQLGRISANTPQNRTYWVCEPRRKSRGFEVIKVPA